MGKKLLDESGFETKHNVNEKIYNKKKSELLKGKDTEYALSISNVLTSRQVFARNLARTKLFEVSLNVPGCVVECGSHRGNGLGLYYNLSSTLEPTNFNRKIISFDTYEGFPSTSEKDLDFAKKGQMSDVDFGFLKEAIEINELNRINGHIEKLIFVKGDANKTIPKFVKENPWLLVSLLYIDFDLYEPTITVLKHLLPLVPKGGVVAFDELAKKRWEGETAAFKELLDANKIKLQRFSFEPGISYFIMGE
jgi:hypothetical protein